MSAGVYVFLGPSLGRDEARAILDAVYLPPVKMGDVQLLLREKPRAIAIIDGFFEQTPAVWHKEILAALEQGVRVFGASSMGALRGAELADLGMEGVGAIFEAFRSGALVDDDEVAVVHAPASEGYHPISEAMVNLRDGLARASAAGAISAGTRELLEAEAKRAFYPERSWSALWFAGPRLGIEPAEIERLRAFVKETRPNLKRDDAKACLAHLAAELGRGLQPHAPRVRLERTSFWLELVASTRPAGQLAGALPYERLRDHLRVTRPDLETLRREALLDHLVEREAAAAGIAVPRERLQAEQERFRRRRGLVSAAATRDWLDENGLDAAGFARLVRLEALTAELGARHARDVDERLGDTLCRRGELAAEHRSARDKQRLLSEAGIVNPTLEDAGADAESLFAWYAGRVRPMTTPLEEHARALGFESSRGFLAELLAEFIHQHHAKETTHDQAS